MFSGKREGSQAPAAVVRDVVEVIAIVAAGIWAIYTFIYVERLKPAWEGPVALITGSLHPVGVRKGYIALQYDAIVKNTGHVTLHLVAIGFEAHGIRFDEGRSANSRTPDGSTTEIVRYDRIAATAPVYRMTQYTHLVNPSYNNGYDLDPGDQVPYSGEFLVKRSDFDEVTLDASIAYTKYLKTYQLKTDPNSLYFQSVNDDPGLRSTQVLLARTALW